VSDVLAEKKLKAELLRVQSARAELEVRQEELSGEVKRLNDLIEIQAAKEKELIERINK